MPIYLLVVILFGNIEEDAVRKWINDRFEADFSILQL